VCDGTNSEIRSIGDTIIHRAYRSFKSFEITNTGYRDCLQFKEIENEDLQQFTLDLIRLNILER